MRRQYTILFAEDERPLRDAVKALLTEHGFKVLTAEDGYGAIRVLVEQSADLLLTDVVMPGISGFELARQAKMIWPHLRVLYMTGHANRPEGREGVRYGKLLQKPIRADEILAEVCQALAP